MTLFWFLAARIDILSIAWKGHSIVCTGPYVRVSILSGTWQFTRPSCRGARLCLGECQGLLGGRLVSGIAVELIDADKLDRKSVV